MNIIPREEMNLPVIEIDNDVYFVCFIIEMLRRGMEDTCGNIVRKIGLEKIRHLLEFADVYHCLTPEQVCGELEEEFKLTRGNHPVLFDEPERIPSDLKIGKQYAEIVCICHPDDLALGIYNVMSSHITDEISDFRTATFYSSLDWLIDSYKAGEMVSTLLE